MRQLLFILYFLLIHLDGLIAQQKAMWFENISIEKGLSDPNVTALFRDSRGFLWIGTKGGGLNRFDGCEMKVFRHFDYDTLSLCNDRITDIMEDKTGYLWIGTEGGISRINPTNGKCKNYTSQNKKLNADYKNFLFKDKNENIWCSNNSGTEQLDTCVDKFNKLKFSNFFYTINSAFDSKGTLWSGGCNGLHSFNTKGLWSHYLPYPNTLARKSANLNILNVKIDRYDNIWSNSWGGGLLRFNPENKCFEKFRWVNNTNSIGPKNIAFDIAESFDCNGKRLFWITTEDGIFQFPLLKNEFPSLSKPHKYFNSKSGVGLLPGAGPTVILSDNDDNLWIGSEGNGIYKYNSGQENFRVVSKIKNDIIEHIIFSKNGDIIACGYKDPLVIMDKEFKRKYIFHEFMSKMDPSDGKISWDVIKDEEHGIIYVATFDGLISINKKLNKHWYPFSNKENNGLIGRKITNIFPLGNNKVLLIFWKGPLQIFNTLSGRNISLLASKTYNKIICRKITKMPDGNIWICCEYNLLIYNSINGQIKEITPNKNWKYNDVLFDSYNRIWLATDHGLCLFDIHTKSIIQIYNIVTGLPSNIINKICLDKIGRMWLLTERGVCNFHPETHRCHTLDKADGLIFGRNPGKMEQMPDGRICLVFGNNIEIFKPELINNPKPSKVYIIGLKINEKDTFLDVPFEKIKEIILKPGENALTFNFTAIDLNSFGKTNFIYKLEGLQNEWVHAGKNHFASFVNLFSGRYVFRVRPEDAGNNASYDAFLTIFVTDFFWQRSWFKYLIIILMVVTGLRFLIYYYRSKIKIQFSEAKRKETIYATRAQIAQDIHDDLGTDLSKISMGASVASMMPDLEKEVLQQKLHSISLEAKEVAEHLRDVVFITNPQYDSFSEVQSYYKVKSSSFLESVGLEAHFDFRQSKINPNVLPEVKRQLFLLLRECLNNVARHANAKEVNLTFIIDEKNAVDKTNYLLEIIDDGIGFDPEQIHHFGNGLKSIVKRAEKIGAKIEIMSSKGKGTTIRVIGPL